MFAYSNILKEVNAALAIIEGAIEDNSVLIAANGILIGNNETAIDANAESIEANAAAIAAKEYVDRGDVGSHDYRKTDLTIDDNWYDMNLSSIVGEASRLVLLRVIIQHSSAGKFVMFRTKGYTGNYNRRQVYTQENARICEQDVLVFTDSSGIIQYFAQTTTWSLIDIVVKGWYKL